MKTTLFIATMIFVASFSYSQTSQSDNRATSKVSKPSQLNPNKGFNNDIEQINRYNIYQQIGKSKKPESFSNEGEIINKAEAVLDDNSNSKITVMKNSTPNETLKARKAFYVGEASEIKLRQKGSENIDNYFSSSNYPNPFNASTNIKFTIPTSSIVKLLIYDANGRQVATLLNEYKEQGSYQYNFEASSLSSGVYIYVLTAGKYSQTKRMILLK